MLLRKQGDTYSSPGFREGKLEEMKAWKNLEECKQYRKLEAGGNNSIFLPHWALNAAPSCSQGTSTEDESV